LSAEAPGQGRPHDAEAAAVPLRVLTFAVGDHLFAVPADEVERIDPSGAFPPGGVSVVDAVGLLGDEGRAAGSEPARRCTVVLRSAREGTARVAVTASRAGDVRTIDASRLLPLPSYLFRGENPFKGLAPATEECGTLFLLAGPDRLRAAAEAW